MKRRTLFSSATHPYAYMVSMVTAMGVMLAGIGVSRLIYPYDLGHLEACTWAPAMIAAGGENPYSFAARPPFVMAPYGYFYYMLIGSGLRLFGLQLWFGRAVSILAVLICVICLGRIAFRLTGNRQATVLALLALLSSITLQHWLGVHRPDLLALALAFAGLTLVFEASDKPDKVTGSSILVIVLLAGAFFFKQTVLLPIGVAAVRHLQMGQRRLALFVALGASALLLFTIAILNLTSESWYFRQHFELPRQVPYSYSISIHWVASMLKAPATWVSLAIIAAPLLRHSYLRTAMLTKHLHTTVTNALSEKAGVRFLCLLQSPGLIIGCYFMLAVTVAFITSARLGSYINYYLEATMAGSIAVAIAWNHLEKTIKGRRLHLSLALLLAFSGAIGIARSARAEYFRWKSLPYYREIVATLKEVVPADRICISVHPELVAAAGHKYHFGDFIQYTDGRSPELQRIFDEEIRTARYAAVIWLAGDVSFLPPEYHPIPMKQPPPETHYAVFLYVRSPENDK